MDASPILPQGWHFNVPGLTADGIGIVTPLARIDHPVRYYIIDYDCSIRFQLGQSPIVHGWGGRDDDVPELTLSERTKPFDQFKLDVFTLGNVFLKDFRRVKIPDSKRVPFTAETPLLEIPWTWVSEQSHKTHDDQGLLPTTDGAGGA